MLRLNKAEKDLREYRDKLESPWKERYLKKIKFIDGRDPMIAEDIKMWDRKKAADFFPSITYMDIVNYLLFTTSTYTREELKAYKGLDAYNQFLCGWVSDKAVYMCKDGKHVAVAARVMHSQSLREKALRPWLVAEHDGVIVFCHCNCMAGLGEVCTHAAALLFAVQASVQIRDASTVTDKPAYWKLPPELKKITYNAIWEIDLSSAKALFKRFNDSLTSPDPPKDPLPVKESTVDEVVATDEELERFYTTLFDTGTKPAILSTIEPYCQSYIPAIVSEIYPPVLSEIYDDSLLAATHAELTEKSQIICDGLTIDADQARCVEEATREQYKTKLWYGFRSGRVTASKAKAVCRTNPENPSKSLIKTICYPEITRFSSKATRWGCRHEEEACKEFVRQMAPYHDGLVVNQCGLFLSTEHPFLGASPDGIVSCNCCGTFLLEVKCPFCARHDCLSENTPNCLLRDEDDCLRLDRNHAFYYQVQTQMGVVSNDRSYFVVWTEEDIHIERVAFDEELFRDIRVKSEAFFVTALLPELLGKFYTRQQPEALGLDLSNNDDTISDMPVIFHAISPDNARLPDKQTSTPVISRVMKPVRKRLKTSSQMCPTQSQSDAAAVTVHDLSPGNTKLCDQQTSTPVTSRIIKPVRRRLKTSSQMCPTQSQSDAATVTVHDLSPGNTKLCDKQTSTPVTSQALKPLNRRLKGKTNKKACALKPVNRKTDVQADNMQTGTMMAANITDYSDSDPNAIWCHCRRQEFGKMVGCDNDGCDYQWFHYRCVGIREEPVGDWYCNDCSQGREDEKENRD